jgi:hypothetical protein
MAWSSPSRSARSSSSILVISIPAAYQDFGIRSDSSFALERIRFQQESQAMLLPDVPGSSPGLAVGNQRLVHENVDRLRRVQDASNSGLAFSRKKRKTIPLRSRNLAGDGAQRFVGVLLIPEPFRENFHRDVLSLKLGSATSRLRATVDRLDPCLLTGTSPARKTAVLEFSDPPPRLAARLAPEPARKAPLRRWPGAAKQCAAPGIACGSTATCGRRRSGTFPSISRRYRPLAPLFGTELYLLGTFRFASLRSLSPLSAFQRML